jgi:hypothetical protein
MNFPVVSGTPTGNFNFTVNASVALITHNITMSLTVQQEATSVTRGRAERTAPAADRCLDAGVGFTRQPSFP